MLEERLNVLEKKMPGYGGVRVVLPQYNTAPSLKHSTRQPRNPGIKESTEYLGADSTPITTSLQAFLSHNRTKASLTEYKSHKLLDHFKEGHTEVVVSTQSGRKSWHIKAEGLTRTHEEADTTIIVRAARANKSG
ncbi:hypothetical protein GWK47_037382 [Chionoecetes opilio]|uniref:Uncharacterized protein n=1 Tax=Chionoecetes opilio TaxID=41210 RepID=A0A8J4YEY2_CHIOP|nr:hypothetical protein GWK47_037382 [Chionoecetes opilio]